MSLEKMLEAEIRLKDEQLADLTKEVERVRRQAEDAGKLAQAAASESKIAELKQTNSKLMPAAKKTVHYAVELDETRRRLVVVEAERNAFAKNCSTRNVQTLALKNALAEAQSDAIRFDTERKAAKRRAKKAEAATNTMAKKKLIIAFAAIILCATTIGGGFVVGVITIFAAFVFCIR